MGNVITVYGVYGVTIEIDNRFKAVRLHGSTTRDLAVIPVGVNQTLASHTSGMGIDIVNESGTIALTVFWLHYHLPRITDVFGNPSAL